MLVFKQAHFKSNEFACKCCGTGQVKPDLVQALEILRRAWGGPVLVNSGYRCAAHNQAVGGAKNSRHLVGLAADVKPVQAQDLTRFKALVRRLFGDMPDFELIEYRTFVHLGVPRSGKN